jgi:subtilisin family serine protease
VEYALDYARARGVLVVAAAGNQGALGSTAITRHPWVIPVVAADILGRPSIQSNLSGSIGRNGLAAPGYGVISLATGGGSIVLGGTSVAAPFVTGTAALLWSVFPRASASQVMIAVTQKGTNRRRSILPRLLNAAAAFQLLSEEMR